MHERQTISVPSSCSLSGVHLSGSCFFAAAAATAVRQFPIEAQCSPDTS